MIRAGWVLSGLSAAFVIIDSFGKFMPPSPFFREELHRLGNPESHLVFIGILQFTCGVLSVIPRTAVVGGILLTGFLGGAEAIQTRVSGSGAFLVTLPLLLGVLTWGGVWLRDERLRNLIPLSTPRAPNRNEVTSH